MIARLSLRLRLLLAVGAVVLVALAIADGVVYASLRSYLYGQVDATLDASHASLEQAAENPASVLRDRIDVGPPVPGAARASRFCLAGRETAPGTFVSVRTPGGRLVRGAAGVEDCLSFQPGRAPSAPRLPSKVVGLVPEAGRPSERVAYFSAPSTTAGGPAFRVRASTLPNGDLLFVATPQTSVTSTLAKLQTAEWLVTVLALVGSLLVGWWLIRVGLRPLRDVERTAEAIADGDLDQRVTNTNPRTEVGHLAAAFNVMLERVEGLVGELRGSEERLRRFVGDASHELRTPLAAVSAYAQLLSQGAPSDRDDLDRAAAGIEHETERMSQLVEDLLLLTKLDEREPLAREPVELVGLALEARETALVVDARWPVDVRAAGPVEVVGDRAALRRVLDNLLANVRAHTPSGTRTVVHLGVDGDAATLEVNDDGPGIDPVAAASIFERFYRVDPSRSRTTGGAGLGLAIVASIVAAHGGTVSADGAPGGGARFVVRLPVANGA
jgi:two-component system OmpR family sensor kinase